MAKRFGRTAAVDGLDLELDDGEILTLLGPSGCGKTTVLRLVAGFETPDRGRILFRGRDISGLAAQSRGFGMVFQHYALFPHLDVFENVAFGLRARGLPESRLRERVEASLERVDLPGFGARKVEELSGGQQQRVALARALAIEPPLLLLDEPLSNLDAALRERTRSELRRLLKDLGMAALFVTHDQEEAFDLSDRVAVMRAGRLHQVGTPETLYDRPAGRFVAGFVGRASSLPCSVERRGGEALARLAAGVAWPLAGGDIEDAGRDGVRAVLVVRPEALAMEPETARADAGEPDGTPALSGLVEDRRFRGDRALYRVAVEGGETVEVLAGREAARPGDRVRVRPRPDARLHAFAASGDGTERTEG